MRRFVGLSVACLVACGRSGEGPSDAGEQAVIEQARALLAQADAWPARTEVLATAHGVEALASNEGAGARAAALHGLAAEIEERLWRLEFRDEDGKAAVEHYRAAGRDLARSGACDAAMRSAKIAGELAHDARVTYAELYRVRRLAAAAIGETAASCASAVDASLASLVAFRPDAIALDAVDRSLAGDGVFVPTDGGTTLVRTTPKIVGIEQWPGAEAARVVVHLDRPASYRVFDVGAESGRPARTYVELDGVEMGDAPIDRPLEGIVARVATEATTTGSRVGLALPGPAYRRVFQLLEPYRIVIDVARHPPGKTSGLARAVSRVVLDPGHGGSDPGARGPTGIEEKDVTLSLARQIAPALAGVGIEVKLTRDDDRYVTLEERTALANAFGADLFVSIHCNAAEKAGRHGIETYVLDTTTSDMAGRVAARENAASSSASNEVASLLASMRLADQATRSTRLAELLLRGSVASLSSYEDVVDGGVHRAGFYVLVGARMPAVLFETGYISHTVEEQRLGSRAYQARLADAVVNAIKAYREGR